MNQKITVFLKIVELGSFSKAAESLYMTQPAVSQFIKSLEKDLGVILFDRSSKSLHLTAAGLVAFQYCLEMKKLSDNMTQSLNELMNVVKGPLMIGASYSYGEYILPSKLAEFIKRYPLVKPSVQIKNTSEIAQEMINKKIDIGIIEGIIEPSRIVCEKLTTDRMVVVSNEPNTEIGHETTWIARENGSGTRSATERFFEKHHLEPNKVLEFGSTQLIKGAVEEGVGVTLLSKWTVQQEVANKKLFIVDEEKFFYERDFYMIYLKTPFQSKTTEMFLKFIRETSKKGDELV
ncbi:LysR substrate-binding domain-containing protein [Ureibacillus sp. 179-F W5.1 NHS]|uniref:LysR family transcriptional regulator n=1 Tax=unclassified Ureibacillus TaxID=2638520 RepID=UPI0031192266